MFRTLSVLSVWIVIAIGAWSQQSPAKLDSIYGPGRLASPDGSRVLYIVPFEQGVNDGPQLWIENTTTHRLQKLLEIPGTLTAEWSPDGTAFYVDDHVASDETFSYIYGTNTLKRLDLAARILASDPASERFSPQHAHSYFDVDSWQGNQYVSVRFHGHTDGFPVTGFEFHYRVSRTGVVTKLSQQLSPLE